LIFRPWIGFGGSRSAWRLATTSRIDGHSSKVRADAAFRGYFLALVRLIFFIHDSLHSERNVRFELERAWAVLRPNGALVVDDIDANWGFQFFIQTIPGHLSLICEAEPLHPDLRRFNKKGLFGIILKQSSEQA
jgi:hypothetical protein